MNTNIKIKLRTLSWCQNSGKIQGGIYSDRTHMQTTTTTTTLINSRRNLHTRIAFQEAFREDFANIQTSSETIKLRPQHIGDVRREYIHCGLELGLESSCFNPSQLRPIQRASELQSYTELQSFESRASNRGTKTQNTVKHRKTLFFDTHFQIL